MGGLFSKAQNKSDTNNNPNTPKKEVSAAQLAQLELKRTRDRFTKVTLRLDHEITVSFFLLLLNFFCLFVSFKHVNYFTITLFFNCLGTGDICKRSWSSWKKRTRNAIT